MHMRSDIFVYLALLARIQKVRKPGQVTHDTDAGNFGSRHTQRGTNTRKVYNATSSHCNSLLFSKIIEKPQNKGA